MKKPDFPVYLIKNSIFSNSQKAFTINNQRKIGEVKNGRVFFTPYEALYLIETKNAQLIKGKSILSEKAEIILSKTKDFSVKYQVFKKLLNKGFIVKTALKFGAEFRVYEKNLSHASYLVQPIKQSDKLDLTDFVSKTRVAHSVAKKLLLAIVDSENDVLFYEINWKKI